MNHRQANEVVTPRQLVDDNGVSVITGTGTGTGDTSSTGSISNGSGKNKRKTSESAEDGSKKK